MVIVSRVRLISGGIMMSTKESKISWRLCESIAVIIVAPLISINPTLSSVWIVASTIASIAGGLSIILKGPHYVEILKKFTISLFVISVLSGSLYSLGIFAKYAYTKYVYAKSIGTPVSPNPNISESEVAITPEPVEIQPYTTPEQLIKELQNKPGTHFTPIYDNERINSIFISTRHNINMTDDVIEKQQLLFDTVNHMIESSTGTIKSGDFNELNGNKTYTDLLCKANSDEELIKMKGETIDLYNNMIVAREKAFKIGKTRALALLLSRDYYNLGRLCNTQGSRQEAFDYYLNALEYYNIVIKLTKENGNYQNTQNDVSYLIGQVYHSIGDIQYLDKEMRLNAYLMSLTYLKQSCENNQDKFLSEYYSGMLLHKLGVISYNDRDIILKEAEKFYNKCLEYSMKKSVRINLYKFEANICSQIIAYNKQYNPKNGSSIIAEYIKKQQTLMENIENLRNTM